MVERERWIRYDEPRPCQVLHEGRWVAGMLHDWRWDPERRQWKGRVTYTVDLLGYSHWRWAEELRPGDGADPGTV